MELLTRQGSHSSNYFNMITVEGLTKRYANHVAVDNISFKVERGQIVGFLGPNGAGKTTTMRVLTCFLPPTSGTARVADFDVLEQPMEVKRRIGYLPETPPLYPEMEVVEYLEYVGRLKGVPKDSLARRVDEVAQKCSVGDVKNKLIGKQEVVIKSLGESLRNISGVAGGETTAEGTFTLEECECLGDCDVAPCVQVNSRFVRTTTPVALDALIDRLRAGDAPPEIPRFGVLSRVRRAVGIVVPSDVIASERARVASSAASSTQATS